jgi:Bacterial protein of unknown function (DUF916)
MRVGIQRRITGLAVLGLALAVLSVATISRVDAAGGNGLRVSPVRTDLTINPGETKTVEVTATNVTAGPATLQTIVNDFMANPNESGDPAIILDPKQYAANHSLKRFVQSVPAFTLAAGQQKTIPVRISVPKNAPGGGYYGAIRFAPTSVDKTSPDQNVTLAGSVGSLVIVKVPGDIKEQLSIASFDVRTGDSASSFFTSNKGLKATVRFQNGGNIQVQPFGKILLKDRSGKILDQYEVNNVDPAGNVLPDSIRKFPVDLKKVGGFGQYKVEGNFGYGSTGQLLSASTTFYVIPAWLIILFIAIVLLLVFIVLVLPRIIRAYNKRIISRAGRALGKSRR